MFERFTQPARDLVVDAQAQARRLGHREIAAEHLLLAVVAETDGLGARVLREFGLQPDELSRDVAALGNADADALRTIGVDLEAVRRQTEARFGPGALDRPRARRAGPFRRRFVQVADCLRFSDSSRWALEQSLRQALALNHKHIGSEHILLGLLADDRTAAVNSLHRLGISGEAVRARLRQELRSAA